MLGYWELRLAIQDGLGELLPPFDRNLRADRIAKAIESGMPANEETVRKFLLGREESAVSQIVKNIERDQKAK